MEITRLAPSPTGALHLGNARTFLINWLLARQNGWRIILRIDDLDGPRIKRGADQEAIDDLQWLGLDWDGPSVYQSSCTAAYAAAIERLIAGGSTFRCCCSRKDVETAASAPHAGDGAAIYPGTCRRGINESQRDVPAVVRFGVPDEVIEFSDTFAGVQRYDAARTLGDFVIRKADGTPAYQLAVVVDDAAAGVTQVVRGDDLLDSTPRQILLYRALQMADRIPAYAHVPLVVGMDGRRLAKRHGDTRLSYYRDRGVPAGRVLSLLAKWCGIELDRPIESAGDLVGRCSLTRVPREPIIFTAADDGFLLGGRPR